MNLRYAKQDAGMLASDMAGYLGLVAKLRSARAGPGGNPVVVYGIGRTAKEAKGSGAVQLRLDCDPARDDACWELSVPSGGKRNVLDRGRMSVDRGSKLIAQAKPQWFKDGRQMQGRSRSDKSSATVRYIVVLP